jgi:RimJ/RimL family protein N-acetyltransferase
MQTQFTRSRLWLISCIILGIFLIYQAQHSLVGRFCANTLKYAAQYAQQHTIPDIKKAPTKAHGIRVTLQKLSYKDYEAHSKTLSIPEVADPFFLNGQGMVYEISPWFFVGNALMGQFFEQRIAYSVLNNRTGEIGGFIEVRRHPETNTYQLGGFARQSHWGRGTSEETTALMMKIFFEILNLPILHSYAAPQNIRAQKFSEKCGFIFSHISEEELSRGYLVYTIDYARYTAFLQKQPLALHIT